MKRRDILAAGAASMVAAPAWVHAQSAWPTRGPVRLVAQFPPGGLVDTVSRLIAPHLSAALVLGLMMSKFFMAIATSDNYKNHSILRSIIAG